MRQPIAVLLPLLLLLPAAARAGGTIRGSVGPAPAKRAVAWLEGVPAAAWTIPKEVARISQRGARFAPDFLVIAAGQTVTMPNDDRITHNVFSVSPAKKFDLGHYPQGETRTVKFEKPGVIDLFCNIHENMHATLVVAPSTFWVAVGPDGKFVLADVPAGQYTLVVYSPDMGTTSLAVSVKDGAATTVDAQLARPK